MISAATLKEAYRRVKQELGDDAVILSSRSVTRRQHQGLGNEKTVEVVVQPPGFTSGRPLGRRVPDQQTGATADPKPAAVLPGELGQEVARIEQLVQEISNHYQDQSRRATILEDNPVAESLLQSGARPATVEKLMTRFISETGKEVGDRVGAITWLTDNLRASNCDWDGFYGCHAFLGRPGCGRSSLIYQAAARLQELGRRTLVLCLMPEHKGEVRRLQAEASRLGFDAAVIQRENQLVKSEAHLVRYDAVLVDMPALGSPQMSVGGPLHGWLANNPSFHRHLVVSLETDPDDMEQLVTAAKDWQGDWVAVSRCDLTGRKGKFLEIGDLVPLPFSLVGERTAGGPQLEIAGSGAILDRILNQGSGPTTRRAKAAS